MRSRAEIIDGGSQSRRAAARLKGRIEGKEAVFMALGNGWRLYSDDGELWTLEEIGGYWRYGKGRIDVRLTSDKIHLYLWRGEGEDKGIEVNYVMRLTE